jgi:tRNA(Arg) A34 adenosine deaminase TadA
MRRAIELALENVRTARGGPFGAVVVRGGTIVGEGVNRVTATNDPTAHAEVIAIRAAGRVLGTFSLAACELYASCEPCPMCLGAAYWARLDRVWFAADRRDAAAAGFDDADLYAELALPLARRGLPMTQLLREEAMLALDEWRRLPDKLHY